MHSKIFQITEEKPLKDNILNDCTLEQGDGHYYDYCSEIGVEERKFHIDNLINNILLFQRTQSDITEERTNGKRNLWQLCKKRRKPSPQRTARCGLEKCTNLKNTSKIRLIQVINSIWTSCASTEQPNNPMSSCVWRAN